MTGPWQHYIPALLQRGFGIPRKSGKPRETWVFTADAAPEIRRIKRTAADTNFYSDRSADPSTTLDGKITGYETPLAVHVNHARSMPPGQLLDANTAAEIVTHLAVRTRHIRELMQEGLKGIARGALSGLADGATVKRVLGLDSLVPSDVFRDSLQNELRRAGLVDYMPESLAVQIMFQLARENFDQFSPAAMDGTALVGNKIIESATNLVQQAHNEGLRRVMDAPGHAWEHLRSLVWTVEAAKGQAILPDCVAIAIDRDRTARPLLLSSRETLAAIIMPLSSNVLLVGLNHVDEPIDVTEFNKHAAACSHHHYQASTNAPEIAQLRDLIGTCSSAVVENEVRQALLTGFPRSQPTGPEQMRNIPAGASPDNAGESTITDLSPFQYEISFIGCADQETAEKIAAVVKRYTAGTTLPLTRLDGITFAGDYAATLKIIDRGIPGSAPIETISADIGTGIAKTILVIRDGVVKGRVVMAAEIGYGLLDEDPTSRWADYVLVYELALVSMIEIVDRTLPNTLLKPIGNFHEGWLFQCVNSALDAYVAAHTSAGLGNVDEIAAHYRDCLVAALERAGAQIPSARVAYRQHADLETLLNVAVPAIRHTLECAANFLGHCDALGRGIIDPDGPLADALERCGLAKWLPTFQADLQNFRQRLGRWESFDEFLRFNLHVERLLWQSGMFPWYTPEGVSRVEVPLAIDAAAFLSIAGNQALAVGNFPE